MGAAALPDVINKTRPQSSLRPRFHFSNWFAGLRVQHHRQVVVLRSFFRREAERAGVAAVTTAVRGPDTPVVGGERIQWCTGGMGRTCQPGLVVDDVAEAAVGGYFQRIADRQRIRLPCKGRCEGLIGGTVSRGNQSGCTRYGI